MSTRYKYSQNTTEATEMFFNVETNGEYIGIEQGSVMKRIPTSLLKSEILAEIDEAKADKDTDAVAGNFAYFDAEGNPVDSGKKDADYEDADPTILKKAQVKDNLTSTDIDLPLSANQGKVLKDAQDVIKGTGWTDETVKGNAEDITTLNGSDTTAGSVLKSIKDNDENSTFTPDVGIGIEI